MKNLPADVVDRTRPLRTGLQRPHGCRNRCSSATDRRSTAPQVGLFGGFALSAQRPHCPRPDIMSTISPPPAGRSPVTSTGPFARRKRLLPCAPRPAPPSRGAERHRFEDQTSGQGHPQGCGECVRIRHSRHDAKPRYRARRDNRVARPESLVAALDGIPPGDQFADAGEAPYPPCRRPWQARLSQLKYWNNTPRIQHLARVS